MIRPFDLRRPSALGEVGALLGEYGDAAALYAGGTELLLLMKEGFVRPRVLVDVKRVPELGLVTVAAGGIEIGATASHRTVERSETVLPTLISAPPPRRLRCSAATFDP